MVHLTTVGAARGIFRDGQIDPRRCRIFQKELAYFFVLRPEYKPKNADEKQSLLDFFPCALVFRHADLGAPFHVYPLDTGGASDGAFDEGKSPWVALDDYELDPTIQGAADHIEWAFGSTRAYFEGELKVGLGTSVPSWSAVLASFVKIASLAQHGSNRPDKRASAIEVAIAQPVRLALGLEFAILPRQLLEDPRGENRELTAALALLGVQPATYDWTSNRRPQDYQNDIRDSLRDYLEAEGVI